jgi:hypothetical protein
VFIAHCVKEHDLHIELDRTLKGDQTHEKRGCEFDIAGRHNYSALLHVNQLLERHVVEENQRGARAERLMGK